MICQSSADIRFPSAEDGVVSGGGGGRHLRETASERQLPREIASGRDSFRESVCVMRKTPTPQNKFQPKARVHRFADSSAFDSSRFKTSRVVEVRR